MFFQRYQNKVPKRWSSVLSVDIWILVLIMKFIQDFQISIYVVLRIKFPLITFNLR